MVGGCEGAKCGQSVPFTQCRDSPRSACVQCVTAGQAYSGAAAVRYPRVRQHRSSCIMLLCDIVGCNQYHRCGRTAIRKPKELISSVEICVKLWRLLLSVVYPCLPVWLCVMVYNCATPPQPCVLRVLRKPSGYFPSFSMSLPMPTCNVGDTNKHVKSTDEQA